MLNYVKSNDDITIIKNANQIIKSIEDLRESLNYERIQLINSMNTNLYLGKEKSNSTDLNFKELIKSIEKFVKKGEMVTLQFRC